MGLRLVLDYNEERQYYNVMKQNDLHTTNPQNNDVTIYLDTISLLNLIKFLLLTLRF